MSCMLHGNLASVPVCDAACFAAPAGILCTTAAQESLSQFELNMASAKNNAGHALVACMTGHACIFTNTSVIITLFCHFECRWLM